MGKDVAKYFGNFKTLAEVEVGEIDELDKTINPIHFMVDYENVHYSGLKGVDYLRPCDTLTIFYSDRCQQIIKKDLDKIKESGCRFDVCKLQKGGKNALDFYIATRIGEELVRSNGDPLTITIVSKDRGYDSVIDYCKMRNPKCVVNSENSIEEGFSRGKGNNAVKYIISDKNSNIPLIKAPEMVMEFRRKDMDRLVAAVHKAEIEEVIDFDKLMEIITAKYSDGKGMYYAIIKEYGMDLGRQLYSIAKKIETEDKNNKS